MTSMKIVQFSRPPLPFSIYVQNSSTPLTLDVQFVTTTPPSSPNDTAHANQRNQNKNKSSHIQIDHAFYSSVYLHKQYH